MGIREVVWRSGRELGVAIRVARERQRLTRTELARRAGVRIKLVRRLESGDETVPAGQAMDVLEALKLELVVEPG
jgi:transcriptional regulator with XRE-family HTH domain